MKRYSKEFKDEALKLSDEIGVKKAAEQLGIEYYTIADWRKHRKADRENAHPMSEAEQRIKIRELERENNELRQANEILKDALGFFATLKKEKLYKLPTYLMTKADVRTVIFRYIFGYNNTQRITSFNPGGLPPTGYRQLKSDKPTTA